MTSQSLNHPVQLLRNIAAELTERQVLLVAAGFLLCIGLIMVGSASMGVAEASYGNPFYFFTRHAIYLCIGLVVGALVLQVPMLRDMPNSASAKADFGRLPWRLLS